MDTVPVINCDPSEMMEFTLILRIWFTSVECGAFLHSGAAAVLRRDGHVRQTWPRVLYDVTLPRGGLLSIASSSAFLIGSV
jgi:hypothetical protein